MVELGVCLRDGLGVPRDRAGALRVFRRAAARGHAGAAALVGQAYWWGRLGAPRDRRRAAPYLLAAARRGDSGARALMGWPRPPGKPPAVLRPGRAPRT